MRLLAAALVLAVLVAGCAGAPDPVPAADAGAEPVTFVEDYALDNTTIPAEELTNATLGDEHVHDAWGGAEQLVLLDDTLAAGGCEGPQDAAFYALVTTFNAEGPSYGCARIALPEGVVVPEGTGALLVEVDATDALKNGGMEFQFRNKAREERLEQTTEPQHAWSIPLSQADWDIAHAPATTFVMYVGAVGPAAVFDGSVKARVVAVKLEGWEPVLAIAHVDHWSLPSLHDFAAPDVMRLGDIEATVVNVDPARLTSGAENPQMPFTDIIAPGASWLAIVADTTSDDCVDVVQCWYVPELVVGGYERTRFGALLHEEDARRIYVWSVPDEVPEDSVYADVSTTMVQGRIDGCAAGDSGGPTCGFAALGAGTLTARLQVFAGKGEPSAEQLVALADA